MAAATGKCNAKTKKGHECAMPAGWGTEHVGWGHCKNHSGATPNGAKAAAREMGLALAVEKGIVSDDDRDRVDPLEALSRLLQVVFDDWLRWEVRAVEAGDPIVRTRYGPRVRPEQVVLEARRLEVLRVAKGAHEAGVEERRVELVEALGGDVSAFLAGIFAGLDLTPAQRELAPEVVRGQLLALEGGGRG